MGTGKAAPAYGTGRSVSLRSGYVRVRALGHPLAGLDGYVYEHRLVLWENGIDPRGKAVHHLNGDKADNRFENLELVDDSEHAATHIREKGRVKNQHGEFAVGSDTCRWGHVGEFAWDRSGKRYCRACLRERARKRIRPPRRNGVLLRGGAGEEEDGIEG